MIYNPWLWLFGVSLFATMSITLAVKRVWNQYEKVILSTAFTLFFILGFIFIGDKAQLLSWFKIAWFVLSVAIATFVTLRAPFLIIRLAPLLLLIILVIIYSPINLTHRNTKNSMQLELDFGTYTDEDETNLSLLIVGKEFTDLYDWDSDKLYIIMKNEYRDPRLFWLKDNYVTFIGISEKPYMQSSELADDILLFDIKQESYRFFEVPGFAYDFSYFPEYLVAEPWWEYSLIRESLDNFILEDY